MIIRTEEVEISKGEIFRMATNPFLSYRPVGIRMRLQSLRQISPENHPIMYTLPTISYPAGIVSWPPEEIAATDVRTQKLLTMHEGFHQFPETLWTMDRKGQWVVSVRATIQNERRNLCECIKKMAPQDKLMKECLRQQKTEWWEGRKSIMGDQVPPWMYHQKFKKSYQKSKKEKAGLKECTGALNMAAKEEYVPDL